MSSNNDEFAPEYTLAEKVRYVALGVIAGGVAVASFKWVLLPHLKSFAVRAVCWQWGSMSGSDVLLYGVFVGVPLFVALTCVPLCFIGMQIMAQRQYPLRGKKVFKPTRIRRDAGVKWIGIAHLCAPLPLILLAVWGAFAVNSILNKAQSAQVSISVCTHAQ